MVWSQPLGIFLRLMFIFYCSCTYVFYVKHLVLYSMLLKDAPQIKWLIDWLIDYHSVKAWHPPTVVLLEGVWLEENPKVHSQNLVHWFTETCRSGPHTMHHIHHYLACTNFYPQGSVSAWKKVFGFRFFFFFAFFDSRDPKQTMMCNFSTYLATLMS